MTTRRTAGLPTRLFTVGERAYVSFDVAPGGQEFLMNLAEPEGLSAPEEVLVDWMRLIKK